MKKKTIEYEDIDIRPELLWFVEELEKSMKSLEKQNMENYARLDYKDNQEIFMELCRKHVKQGQIICFADLIYLCISACFCHLEFARQMLWTGLPDNKSGEHWLSLPDDETKKILTEIRRGR